MHVKVISNKRIDEVKAAYIRNNFSNIFEGVSIV